MVSAARTTPRWSRRESFTGNHGRLPFDDTIALRRAKKLAAEDLQALADALPETTKGSGEIVVPPLDAFEQAIWDAYAAHYLGGHPPDPEPADWPEWLIAAALATHDLAALQVLAEVRQQLDDAIDGERELRNLGLRDNDHEAVLIHGAALSALASFRATLTEDPEDGSS